VLLLGNIRRNLDPFDEFSDDELWNVLGQVQLLDRLGEKGNGVGLGTKVSKIPYNGS
jgi:ABC-type multidrug transport system fused ATPase/permease subunit